MEIKAVVFVVAKNCCQALLEHLVEHSRTLSRPFFGGDFLKVRGCSTTNCYLYICQGFWYRVKTHVHSGKLT